MRVLLVTVLGEPIVDHSAWLVESGSDATGHSRMPDAHSPRPKARRRARDRADVRGHDLRRTAARLTASGGVPRFLISRILNHSQEQEKDITSVYDQYSYNAEKRAAMEFWGERLPAVLGGMPLTNAGRFPNAPSWVDRKCVESPGCT